MQSVVECIVLNALKYGDNSLIVNCLTETDRQSFFLKAIVSKNRNKYPFLSYPMAIVECHYLEAKTSSLPLVKQLSLSYVPKSTGYDFRRQAMATFMAELALKYIREETMNSDIFYFLKDNIIFLDSADTIASVYPIWLAFELATLLGFGAGKVDNNSELFYFSFEKGLSQGKSSQGALNSIDSRNLQTILNCTESELHLLNLNSQSVRNIFQAMLLYFRYHFPESGTMRSPEILHDLMA
jgi:DNA repair protein RecO (recombination protein O)